MAKCMLCAKGPVSGHNVPKSMHKTKRRIQPNIQKVSGIKMCTRCLRSIKRLAAAPVTQMA